MFITCKVKSVNNGALRISIGCRIPLFSLMVYIVGLNLRVTAKMRKNIKIYHIHSIGESNIWRFAQKCNWQDF